MDDSKVEHSTLNIPEYGPWVCYMFGNRPGKSGIVFRPEKGNEPNRFVRFMMLICFDCLWVKENDPTIQ